MCESRASKGIAGISALFLFLVLYMLTVELTLERDAWLQWRLPIMNGRDVILIDGGYNADVLEWSFQFDGEDELHLRLEGKAWFRCRGVDNFFMRRADRTSGD